MASQVRERREALGLTQAEVAAAAGLSRQLVTALEAGRHSPSVTAGIALARALDTTVEALFGDRRLTRWETVVGDPVPDGALVTAARVGERAVFAPVPRRSLGGPSWPKADGVVSGRTVRSFDGRVPEGFVVAGCDPALGLAAELLPQGGPRRLMAVPATSGAAIRALGAGTVHAALVHGPPERLEAETPGAERRAVARWRVGVASRGPLELAAIAEGRLTMTQRPPGAEAQRALERALEGRAPSGGGPAAEGHLDAARLVAEGSADAGVTMEAAANLFDLGFMPLEEHTVELRVAERWLAHPGAAALLEVFASRDLAARLAALGGYELLARR
ncbi:MAG: substrate-binding domain-containing protein [Actinomycetota bacterium]